VKGRLRRRDDGHRKKFIILSALIDKPASRLDPVFSCKLLNNVSALLQGGRVSAPRVLPSGRGITSW